MPGRIFLVRGFVRFAHKNRIGHSDLIALIDRANLGIVDADLGGGLIKLRLSRPKEGKSGGYRTIVAFRRGDRAFFLFGFAKNEQANIGASDLAELRRIGADYMEAGVAEIEKAVSLGKIVELEEEQ